MWAGCQRRGRPGGRGSCHSAPRSSWPATTTSTSDSGRRTPRPKPIRSVGSVDSPPGGGSICGFGAPLPNSEVRASATFGMLVLTLHENRHKWESVPVEGSRSSIVVRASAIPDGTWRGRCQLGARSTSTDCRFPGRSAAMGLVGRGSRSRRVSPTPWPTRSGPPTANRRPRQTHLAQ
jgi:hypothetical protein